MITQVKAWGNSQGIRLPKDLMESIGIRLDDFISIEIQGDSMILKRFLNIKH